MMGVLEQNVKHFWTKCVLEISSMNFCITRVESKKLQCKVKMRFLYIESGM